MKTDHNGKSPFKWALMLLLAAIAVAGLIWRFGAGPARAAETASGTSPVFTPAHASLSDAVKEFFWIRPKPVQPIAFTHTVHINKAKLQCAYCHEGVETGPIAGIPSINKCMECHEFTATDKPAVQQILEYNKKGEDIPWQRVYGWPRASHVRFNHAPHIRAKVDCSTCHGDIPSMTVAERVVKHTMEFCVDCHTERKASLDCMACHY